MYIYYVGMFTRYDESPVAIEMHRRVLFLDAEERSAKALEASLTQTLVSRV